MPIKPEVAAIADETLETTDLRQLHKEQLARALDIICRDSRANPQRYLEETKVPHGGE